jgi:hypothetical protein
MKKVLIIIIILVILAGIGLFLKHHFRWGKPKSKLPIDRSKIRIEIINCSGLDKQATRAQEFLRSAGFDVYELRSGKRVIDKTTIIERVAPDLQNARAVSEALACYKKSKPIPIRTVKIIPEIQKDLDSLLYLEVTVVLGKDCETFLPKTTPIY